MSSAPVPPPPEPRPAVELCGDRCVITVTDSLDIATAPPLHETITDLIESDRSRIVLDMTRMDFCDSSGLRVLIAGHKRATANGGQLRLANIPGQLRRLLRTTCLDGVLCCDTDVDESVSHLGVLRTMVLPQSHQS